MTSTLSSSETSSHPSKIFPSTMDLSSGPNLSMIKEHDEETDEAIRKQYENMSYDEMRQHLAESYKQLTTILGTQDISPAPSSIVSEKTTSVEEETTIEGCKEGSIESGLNFSDDMTEEEIIEDQYMDDSTKKSKMTKLFWRTCSTGDIDKVKHFLQNDSMKFFIDIDAKDEDGTTPLIYAACFGKIDIAQVLLSAGAKIDIQDSCKYSRVTNNVPP